jgi:ComF family protein
VKAAVAYGDIARSIILKFKRGRRIGLARLSADAMSRHLPQGSYIIVPVPLHRWRLWSRGFNQSALLAEQLSAYSGQPVLKHILERTKATPMLGGLGAKARRDALQGAFKVSSSGKEALMGKTVVLIDDVYTSGATTEGCTRALKRSGAARVVILCWARVIDKD